MRVYAIQLGDVLISGPFDHIKRSANGKILFLNVTKHWFEEINSGRKKEEYRECKPFWDTRMQNAPWDLILFANGYGPSARSMLVEYKGMITKDVDVVI